MYHLASDRAARRTFHDDMVRGFRTRMRAAGNTHSHIAQSMRYIEQFVTFTGGRYAWEWTMDDVDAWGAQLVDNNARSTVRGQQGALRAFLAYATDPAYSYARRCAALFHAELRQLCVPENTTIHTFATEGNPERRPLTDEELSRLFAALHARMQLAIADRHKGELTAARDYAMSATDLGWGLRARELAGLDTFDFSEAPDPNLKRAYGAYGVLTVRLGKAKRRGTPRRRQVLSVPLFAFAVDVIRWYVEEVRPRFPTSHDAPTALWLNERGERITANYASKRFALAAEHAGLPKELSMHCLRHTYVTRLIEHNYSELFVQQQVGHEDSAVTAGYTHVGDDFKRRIVLEQLEQLYASIDA
jgi:integrase/recombinase XerC